MDPCGLFNAQEEENASNTTQTDRLGKGEGSENRRTSVTDAELILNMADVRPTHGVKRQLSLSPSTIIHKLELDKTVPDNSSYGREGHSSKKRVIFCQVLDERNVCQRTGNDPEGGHLKTGSNPINELSRSKSNMAAPMSVTKTNQNAQCSCPLGLPTPSIRKEPDSETSPILTATPLLNSITAFTTNSGKTSEGAASDGSPNPPILTKISSSRMGSTPTPPDSTSLPANSISYADSISNNPVQGSANTNTGGENSTSLPTNKTTDGENSKSLLSKDGETSTSLLSNTTIGEKYSTSDPKNTTVGGSTSLLSNTTIGEEDSTSGLFNLTVGEESSTFSSSSSLANTTIEFPIPLSSKKAPVNKIKQPSYTDIPSASQGFPVTKIKETKANSTSQVNLRKPRLRSHCGTIARRILSPSCDDCPTCKSSSLSVNSTSKNKNPVQQAPKKRGRPKKKKEPNPTSQPLVHPSPSVDIQQNSQNISKNTLGIETRPNPYTQPNSNTDSNVDTQFKSQDIYGVLIDIKNELGEVKDKQETCHGNLCDVKQSLGVEIGLVKEKMGKNANLLVQLQASNDALDVKFQALENIKTVVDINQTVTAELKEKQNVVSSKVDELNEKVDKIQELSDGIELEIFRQKKNQTRLSQSVNEHVSEIENELVSHVEVVKSNMKGEVTVVKQTQKQLEDKLANFTEEIVFQNSNLNVKIHDLRKDFEQLKTLNETASSASYPLHGAHYYRSPYSSPASSRTESRFSTNSTQSRPSCSCNPHIHLRPPPPSPPQNSCDPQSHPQNNEPFYMYGDTTKSLIFDGLKEFQGENIKERIWECVLDIGVPLDKDDILDVFRIGRLEKNRVRPRPVKLILVDTTIRDQIFLFKARLRFSDSFKAVRINKEERKDLRIKIAKLRQAAQLAKKMGHRVDIKTGEIFIDGQRYNAQTLENIPKQFMEGANQIKCPPINSQELSQSEKCRTRTGMAIMVGPALQKTPYGLAFYSYQCFLSNFYKVQIYFQGQTYTCLEQGYQCVKAETCNDGDSYDKILEATSPVIMKEKGNEIVTNDYWQEHKLEVMEDLLFCKFQQNKQLYYMLMNTRPWELIEATLDNFWGAGSILGSFALEDGSWEGQNNLGKLLMKVRDHFVKELEIGQGSIQ